MLLSRLSFIQKGFESMNKRFSAALLGLSLVLVMTEAVQARELLSLEQDLDGALVILHTNDSHGRILSGPSQVGFYQVSGIRQHLESVGATVIVLDSGDTLHGLPIATIRQGADIVEIMNAVGFDAMAPGNHDFNYGHERLHELRNLMNFPILAANVVDADGALIFDGHTVVERGGFRVGVFGLATQDTPIRTHPNNVTGLSFTDPAEAAAKQVALLQEAGADLIIAVSHVGIDESTEITSDIVAASVDGIHILIDGHSHVAIEQSMPRRDDISLVPHGDTVMASTDGYMAQLGVIIIQDGVITSTLVEPGDDLPTDTVIQTILSELTEAQDEILSQIVGHTDVLLDGERINVRTTETNLGNLSADAIMAFTDADLAVTNGGGIRDSIAPGPITRRDLVTVFPFGNYVVTLEVSGASILEALEHSVSLYPAENGAFLQVAGMSFAFDPGAEPGNRVFSAHIAGEPIDSAAYYILATNNFLADGGDGYTMLPRYTVVGMFSALEEILIDYIVGYPEQIAAISEQGRIVAATPVDPEELAQFELFPAPQIPSEMEQLPAPEEPQLTPIIEPISSVVSTPSQQGSTSYTVTSGDSLYKIAGSLLGNTARWPEIYYLNRGVISQPHIILIGWVLVIPSS
jgi:5'-nucleotidase